MNNTITKKFFLAVVFLFCLSFQAYGDDLQELIGQASQIYGASPDATGQGIAGFSVWGIVGTLLFSTIGLVAFMYGKKRAEAAPIIFGIVLMAYPYFLKGTVALYLVGFGLTCAFYLVQKYL